MSRGVLVGTLAAALLAAGAVTAMALVLAEGSSGATRAPAQTASRFDGGSIPAGFSLPPFTLRDQNGRRASVAQYRGHVVVLTFMFSHCRDTCPIMAQQIRGALDDLRDGGRGVGVLAVSVDPAHDTPASARRFVAHADLTGRMRFLMGSRRQLVPIWIRQGIQPKTATSDHSAFVFLLDRRGRERVAFEADELTPEGLAHDLRILRAEPA
jgi:protein SCO1/2